DLGLFTAHPDFGEDTTALFNLLTGYAGGYKWKKLLVAPLDLRDQIVALIERERRHAQAGRPARIIVKMNALVEPSVIDALYGASQAGVRSEEHTSELQSRSEIVCRLLLEKKKSQSHSTHRSPTSKPTTRK